MKELLPYAEFLLLVVVTLLNIGRWSQKQEATPESLAKDLAQLKTSEAAHYEELRKHRHEWNSFLNTLDYRQDKKYVRRDVYEAEKKAIVDKQDSDCDRISELESWRNRMVGIG